MMFTQGLVTNSGMNSSGAEVHIMLSDVSAKL